MPYPLLISVIIPVYNGEHYLAEALESVLAQTRPADEIIVVDDGSTDGSAAVAQRFGLKVQLARQANLGAAAARNLGVELAYGSLLAFLDADDLWLPDKLALQSAAFADKPELEAVLGHIEQFYSPDVKEPAITGRPPALWEAQTGPHLDTLLIRRAAFERIGPFDPAWQVAQMVEWFMRAETLAWRVQMLPQRLARRRIHAQNMGIRQKALARVEYLRLLKLKLDRQRGGQ
jgi:glycosyltransferase involved in cell wall biosynthesis